MQNFEEIYVVQNQRIFELENALQRADKRTGFLFLLLGIAVVTLLFAAMLLGVLGFQILSRG